MWVHVVDVSMRECVHSCCKLHLTFQKAGIIWLFLRTLTVKSSALISNAHIQCTCVLSCLIDWSELTQAQWPWVHPYASTHTPLPAFSRSTCTWPACWHLCLDLTWPCRAPCVLTAGLDTCDTYTLWTTCDTYLWTTCDTYLWTTCDTYYVIHIQCERPVLHICELPVIHIHCERPVIHIMWYIYIVNDLWYILCETYTLWIVNYLWHIFCEREVIKQDFTEYRAVRVPSI